MSAAQRRTILFPSFCHQDTAYTGVNIWAPGTIQYYIPKDGISHMNSKLQIWCQNQRASSLFKR